MLRKKEKQGGIETFHRARWGGVGGGMLLRVMN
jgi:hypothetical protein